MKLYLIQRPLEEVGYDEAEGFVVRASNEQEARAAAAADAGDEGADTWLDPRLPCVELKPAGKGGVVLRSFQHG